MTRALIVGCGRIAGGYNESDETRVLSHVVALRRAGAEIVGCVDRDAMRARAFATRWKIADHHVDLVESLTRLKPDLVVDCTPPNARYAVTSAALAASSVRVVIAEKPLGRTSAEASALGALIRATDKPVIIGYQRAFDPCYIEAEVLVRRGALGHINRVAAIAYGGALANMSHMLERVFAMVGSPIEAALISAPIYEDDNDPGLSFRATFGGDVEGSFLAVPRAGPALIELDLIGSEGRLRILDSECRVELSRALPSADGVARPMKPATQTNIPRPDDEAICHIANAAIAAARQPVHDMRLLERAVDAVVVIDSLRRTGAYAQKNAA